MRPSADSPAASPDVISDVVGTYAAKIRTHLQATPGQAFTVAELRERLNLSDRLVRMGLDRLVFCREVQVSFRHQMHRRGSMPREYRIVVS